MFKGAWSSKIDEHRRLYLPAQPRKRLLRHFGSELFVTSITGKEVLIYPLSEWEKIEREISAPPKFTGVKQRFRRNTTYWGQEHRLERTRVSALHPHLNAAVNVTGELLLTGSSRALVGLDFSRAARKMDDGLTKSQRRRLDDLAKLPNEKIVATFRDEHRARLTPIIQECSHELLKYLATHPKSLYEIRPRVFEIIVGEIFKSQGFEVELTAQTRDGGADLIAVKTDAFGIATRYIVECKRFAPDRRVSVRLIRSLYGVKESKSRRADHAVFVTTSFFSRDAWRSVENGEFRNLTLADYERLKEWLLIYLEESH